MSTTLVVETSKESHAILRNGLSCVTQLQVTLGKHSAVIKVVNSQGGITSGHITVDRESMIAMAQKILTQDYRDQNTEVGDEQAEYLSNPHLCPFCGSHLIGSEPPKPEGSGATAECWCDSCEMQWVDCYELTGFVPLKEPDDD